MLLCVSACGNDDENWNYDIGSVQMDVILNDMDQKFPHFYILNSELKIKG